MGKSVLQQLFDGEIFPSENINSNDPQYIEAKKLLAEEKELFLNKLSGDAVGHFKRIADIYYTTENIYSYECFAHGFRLAVKLIVESINGSHNLTEKSGE